MPELMILNKWGLLDSQAMTEDARRKYSGSIDDQVQALTAILDQTEQDRRRIDGDQDLTAKGKLKAMDQLVQQTRTTINQLEEKKMGMLNRDLEEANKHLPTELPRPSGQGNTLSIEQRVRYVIDKLLTMQPLERKAVVMGAVNEGSEGLLVLTAVRDAPAILGLVDHETYDGAWKSWFSQNDPSRWHAGDAVNAAINQLKGNSRSAAKKMEEIAGVVVASPDVQLMQQDS